MEKTFVIKEGDSKEIILENMSVLKEYYDYIKNQDNKLLSNNHNFELNLSLTQMIHLLKTVQKKYEELETITDEETKASIQKNINSLYSCFKEIYQETSAKFNLQEEIQKNVLSDDFVKQNFFVSKNSILGINQYLIGKNGVYFLYIGGTGRMTLRCFNLTTKIVNGNHLSKDGNFCSGTVYKNLYGLFRTDIPAFLAALSATLSDHDDGAYHMATKNSFKKWREFFEDCVEGGKSSEGHEVSGFIESINSKVKYIKTVISLSAEEKNYLDTQAELIKEWIKSF